MTPEQALQVLDQAASQAALGRAAHVQVQEAVKVLAKALEAHSEATAKTKLEAMPDEKPA